MTSITKLFIIHGIVQGVGFRYFVCRAANDLSITGTVCNRINDTVEVVAQGTEEQLKRLESLLKEGPPAARVTKIDISLTSIDIRPDFDIT